MEVISHQVTVEVAKATCDDVTKALKTWQEAARDFYGAKPPDMFALIGLTQLVGPEQNVPEILNYILVIEGIRNSNQWVLSVYTIDSISARNVALINNRCQQNLAVYRYVYKETPAPAAAQIGAPRRYGGEDRGRVEDQRRKERALSKKLGNIGNRCTGERISSLMTYDQVKAMHEEIKNCQKMYNTLMSQSLDPDAMLEAVINGTTIDVQDALQN